MFTLVMQENYYSASNIRKFACTHKLIAENWLKFRILLWR